MQRGKMELETMVLDAQEAQIPETYTVSDTDDYQPEPAPETAKPKRKGLWSRVKKLARKSTTPMTLKGMIAKVSDDRKLSEFMDDPRMQKKVEEIVGKKFAKYKSELKGYIPAAAQIGGTKAALGADALYVLSGGIGWPIKNYAVGARGVAELPTMLRTAYKEGLYHGIGDTAVFGLKKAVSLFTPFIGTLIDLGSVKNYARNAVVRESVKEARKYLKKEYLEEKNAAVEEAEAWKNRLKEQSPAADGQQAAPKIRFDYQKMLMPTGHLLN